MVYKVDGNRQLHSRDWSIYSNLLNFKLIFVYLLLLAKIFELLVLVNRTGIPRRQPDVLTVLCCIRLLFILIVLADVFVFARQCRIASLEGLTLCCPIKTAIGMVTQDFHGLKAMTFHCFADIAYF